MKYFKIILSVETSDNENLETFTDKIMDIIEINNWTVGGGFEQTDSDGMVIPPTN